MKALLILFLLISTSCWTQKKLVLKKDGKKVVLKKGDKLDFKMLDGRNESYRKYDATVAEFLSTGIVVIPEAEIVSYDTINRSDYSRRKYKKKEWIYNVYHEGYDADCQIVMAKLEIPQNDTVLYTRIEEINYSRGRIIHKVGFGMFSAGVSLFGIAPFTGIHSDQYKWHRFFTTLTSGVVSGTLGLLFGNSSSPHLYDFNSYTRTLK